LFGPNAVPYDASSQGGSGGTSAGGSGGTGGGGPPGDGNEATSTIRGSVSGTATFTQTGVSVTVEINLTGCPSGDLVFTIHDGFSCDNADTEGVPWGARGEIGTVNCNGNSGSGTFTRDGTDSNANWTVADHTLETDVSAHVIIVTTPADSETRIACGNFF
jgi:Cu/Zn superoxide dismutase